MADREASLSHLAKQAFTYGLAVFVQRAASFVLLPVYTRYLTPADYGTLQMVQLTLDVVAIALTAGTTAGAMRFYFKEEDNKGQGGGVIVTALLLLLAFNLLAALALFATAPAIATTVLENAGQAELVRLAALGFLLEPISSVPLILMQIRGRARLYSVTSVIRLLLQLTLNIVLLVGLGWGVEAVLVSTCVTNAVIGLGATSWLLRQPGLRPRRRFAASLLSFGLPYRVTTAGTFILTFADRYFLKASRDLEAVGIYGLAYQFGFLLVLSSAAPFMQAWSPQRFASVGQPKAVRDALHDAGFRYFSVTVVGVGFALAVFARPVIEWMAAPGFRAAADIVPIIVAAYVLQAWTDVVEFGIQVSEQTRYATYAAWCAVVVVLVLYVALIPPLGGLGAALATFGAFLVRFLCSYRWSQKLWPIGYQWGPQLRLVTYAVLGVAATRLWEPSHVVGQIGLGCVASIAFLALVWAGGVIPADDRSRVLAFVRAGLRPRASSGAP